MQTACSIQESQSPNAHRRFLQDSQPEVLDWLASHLEAQPQEVAIELSARYFEIASRWGEVIPRLKRARLNLELAEQLETIAPTERWIAELPIPSEPAQRRAVSRLLRAMVSVSTKCTA